MAKVEYVDIIGGEDGDIYMAKVIDNNNVEHKIIVVNDGVEYNKGNETKEEKDFHKQYRGTISFDSIKKCFSVKYSLKSGTLKSLRLFGFRDDCVVFDTNLQGGDKNNFVENGVEEFVQKYFEEHRETRDINDSPSKNCVFTSKITAYKNKEQKKAVFKTILERIKNGIIKDTTDILNSLIEFTKKKDYLCSVFSNNTNVSNNNINRKKILNPIGSDSKLKNKKNNIIKKENTKIKKNDNGRQKRNLSKFLDNINTINKNYYNNSNNEKKLFDEII